jgi:hypothetical protein
MIRRAGLRFIPGGKTPLFAASSNSARQIASYPRRSARSWVRRFSGMLGKQRMCAEV